jgi:iron(III) transport system substrate-binding protein
MNNWKKKVIALALTGCALFSLTGCGSKSASKGNAGKGQITLYTSQPEADVQKMITAFNKEHPDIKVSVFRSGTEEVISKVMAEDKAGAIKADVLLVADDVTFTRLKDKSMLEAYESKELKDIPAQFIDKDHMYTGTKVITTGIMVNTQKAKNMPAGLADLTKPEYKDQIIMPSPLYSGAAAYNLGVLTRTKGIGWEWYKALKANGIKVDKGNGAVQKAVAAGEKAYGLVADYMANRSRKKGSAVTFVYPAEGSPFVTEPIGLLKASKNKEAAKLFIDFVLSAKGQQIAADMGYTPVKKGIKAPEGLKSIDQFKPLTGDVSQLFKSRETDKSEFSKLFH